MGRPPNDEAWSWWHLESGVQVELQRVYTQGRAVDRIRTQIAQAHPDPVRDADVADQVVPLGIGSAPVEIRIRIRVDDRIAFQVAIADDASPGARRQHRRMAEAEFRLVPLRAGRDVRTVIRRHLRGVVADIPYRIGRDAE